jgi:hypothetical protein
VKKLFAIAFTCVYLTLAVGVVQTTHYCMGRVKSTSVFTFDSAKCPCYLFAKDGNKKCCNDEHEIIKIEDDHTASHVISIVPDYLAVAQIIGVVYSAATCHQPQTVFDESPPPPHSIPLFTKHCSLVFYDDAMIA